jgi:hypothetical protein
MFSCQEYSQKNPEKIVQNRDFKKYPNREEIFAGIKSPFPGSGRPSAKKKRQPDAGIPAMQTAA